MTESEFRISPLPDNESDALLMIHAAIRDCTADIQSSLPFFIDRLHIFSDYDDYIPAAIQILEFLSNAILSHEHDSYCAIIAAFFADDELCNDALTCDFRTPLFELIDYAE